MDLRSEKLLISKKLTKGVYVIYPVGLLGSTPQTSKFYYSFDGKIFFSANFPVAGSYNLVSWKGKILCQNLAVQSNSYLWDTKNFSQITVGCPNAANYITYSIVASNNEVCVRVQNSLLAINSPSWSTDLQNWFPINNSINSAHVTYCNGVWGAFSTSNCIGSLDGKNWYSGAANSYSTATVAFKNKFYGVYGTALLSTTNFQTIDIQAVASFGNNSSITASNTLLVVRDTQKYTNLVSVDGHSFESIGTLNSTTFIFGAGDYLFKVPTGAAGTVSVSVDGKQWSSTSIVFDTSDMRSVAFFELQ